MTLLEDARRLAEKNPHDAGWACFSCGMPNGRNSGFGDTHHTGCPWLALPKIVAALEAAEELSGFYGKLTFIGGFPGSGELCRLTQALVAALRGEDVPT